jgi:hypothetical protein
MMKKNSSRHPMGSGAGEQSGSRNRCGADRRIDNRARLKYLLFNGRRERIRREEDRGKVFFFDRYPPKLFAAITAILMLSILDALLTLILIHKGSSELNPVMAYFLEHGLLPFIIAKYLLTSMGVFILLIFKNIFLTPAKIHTRSLFSAVIVAFAAVIAWELFLIFTAPRY